MPIPEEREDALSLHSKAQALFKTAEFMESFGVHLEPTEMDKVKARAAFHESVEAAGKGGMPIARTDVISTSASAVHLRSILSEYDEVVVKSAVQIRTYVTNKLIEESTNPDAKIRMRALELLGKVGDVGLFIERTEVTVKHKTTLELETSIKDRISKLLELRSAREMVTDVTPKKTLQENAADVLSTPVQVPSDD